MTSIMLATHLRDHGWPAAGRRPPAPGGRAVLEQRYARGDIDDGEFRHRQAVLGEEGQ